MVNPFLQKKQENNLTVNEPTKKLFKVIYDVQKKSEKADENIPKIKVSSLISKLSFYYEKIRNTVDYNEEYLLKKDAIQRILKRQIIIEGSISLKQATSVDISKHLITELIRAGYLPNNVIPEIKINEIAEILDKYLKLKYEIFVNFKNSKIEKSEKNNLINWILGIAAANIEEALSDKRIENAELEYLYQVLDRILVLPDYPKYQKNKKIQIYLGIYRNLFKYDDAMLSFVAFKYYVKDWPNVSSEVISEISKDIFTLKQAIESQIINPLTNQMNKIIGRYTVCLSILVDVIKENPVGKYEELKNDQKAFERSIKEVCDQYYKQTRGKLWGAAVRSLIYILITKTFFAILLEVPAMKWLGATVNTLSLAINIAFPALLLFFLVLVTRVPGENNTLQIIKNIEELVYTEKEKKDPIRLRMPAKRGFVLNSVFTFIYTITFFLSFGVIIWILDKAGFHAVSIAIFLFFLVFVSYFSIRIRKDAHKLILTESKENIFSFFADFFYVPIVATGKWLSEKFHRLNIFVFILDFIIEAPFKIFIEISEEWTKYVKERKDDLV